MSRRIDDYGLRDFAAACAFSAFIGGLGGGLIASLIMSGVMLLGGAA